MRYAMRATIGMLLVGVFAHLGVAEETTAPWWKFGLGEPSADSGVQSQSPVVEEDQSWFKWPALPTFGSAEAATATDVSTPASPQASAAPQKDRNRTRFGRPAYQHSRTARNSWAQSSTETTSTVASPSPWQSVSDGTRTAWRKTVDFVTPGEPSDSPVVQTQPQTSWWSRMWGAEENVDQGPQTVTEWMAQERLDP